MSVPSPIHLRTSYLVREVGDADTTDADGRHVGRCRREWVFENGLTLSRDRKRPDYIDKQIILMPFEFVTH